MSPSRILVGRFGAPHGVRGEVRLQSFTQDPRAIGDYGPLTAEDGRAFALIALRPVRDNLLVAKVSGIADRTAAESLTNLDLYLDRTALPPPDEDEFYVADLIGLEAVTADGTPLGPIIAVPNYGGGDLLEIRPPDGGETQLIPFTRTAVPAIDLVAHRVTILLPEVVAEESDRSGLVVKPTD